MQALKRNDGLYLVRFDQKVYRPHQIVTHNYENLDGPRRADPTDDPPVHGRGARTAVPWPRCAT